MAHASSTTPAGGRSPHGRVLAVAASGAFLAFLDATIVNVAFPSIRASFPTTSINDLSWVLNAYNIVFAAFLVVFGRMSDLLGRRRTFVAGIWLFTAASLACGLAGSVEVLVVARVVQALGAALLVPASLALVVEAFPADRRAHGIGLWGATAAVAAGLGPPVGGALVELGGWRWAFLVNLPLGVAAVLAARSTLVESRAPGRRRLPDLRGAALLAGFLALLNLGVVQGPDWGWTAAGTVGAFAGAALLLAGFVASSRASRSPLLDPALLRLSSFRTANLATALAGFGFFAYLLCNVLWLTYVWDYSVLRAGLALMPGAVVAAVVASRLGPLADRYGYRWVVAPGALVWAGAYVWYHQRAGLEPAFLTQWLPGQVLSGIGVGATLPVLGSAALAAVPGGRFATASAVVSSTRQVGGVLGISVLVVVVGTPTPLTVVASLRDGWLLSVVAFLVVAVLAATIGRVDPGVEAEDEPDEPASVLLPSRVIRLDAAASGLSEVALFAGLPAAARLRLERAARTVRVAAGEDVVREGEAADAAFVVVSGRLQVLIGGAPVRELGPGAVLGELSVLTGEVRSATVRARRDAVLLEVTAADFRALLAKDPGAATAVATQLAARLRAPAPAAAAPASRPGAVAVVGTHAGSAAGQVADALERRLAQGRRVVRLTDGGAEQVEAVERDGALALLVAGSGDGAWRDLCVRQADQVVLVASADATPPAVAAPLAPQPDVVLVGRSRPGPDALAAWAEAVDAWQVTVSTGDLDVDLRPLADRVAGRSVGLVLAGGGARAFAHIGVLRELEDAGVHVDRIAGCSVGSLIAGAWATGMDGAALDAACYEGFVRRRPFSDYTLPLVSLARGRRAEALLARVYGEGTRIEGLPRQFSCVSTDLTTRSRRVHRRGDLAFAARASAGLPVLLPPKPDGRSLLVDGGVLDNMPVDLLTARDEGPVVAVTISMGGGEGPRSAPSPGTPRPARVPALGETLLRTMMIGSAGAVAHARELGAVVLAPSARGVGLLEFSQLDRMVEAGRQAARVLLGQCDGDLARFWQPPTAVPAPRAAPTAAAGRDGRRTRTPR